MNNDFDKIEEELKKESQKKKPQKISGRSVFDLQRIIKEKSDEAKDADKEKDIETTK